MHPSSYQMEQVFNKYFASIGTSEECKLLIQQCHTCQSIRKYPVQLDNEQRSSHPDHPGSHFNVDVIRRAGQKILVNSDLFSGFTTATFLETEGREDMIRGLLTVTTPVRHNHSVSIKADKAPAFTSLVTNPSIELKDNGIHLTIGQDFNKNSN